MTPRNLVTNAYLFICWTIFLGIIERKIETSDTIAYL